MQYCRLISSTLVDCHGKVLFVVPGVLCQMDVNECASDPCPEESVCFNFDGGYACNCSDPALCPSLYTNIVSSSWGVSWEEVIGIVGKLLLCVIMYYLASSLLMKHDNSPSDTIIGLLTIQLHLSCWCNDYNAICFAIKRNNVLLVQ